MLITCENNQKVDTSRLSSEERHIIQKLLAWESLVPGMEVFREKTAAALYNRSLIFTGLASASTQISIEPPVESAIVYP